MFNKEEKFLTILMLIIVAFIIIGSYRTCGSAEPSPAYLERQKQEEAKLALLREDSANRYAYSQLSSESDEELYIKILDSLKKYEEILENIPPNKDRVYRLFDYVLKDYPDLFWVRPKIGIVTHMIDHIPSRYDLEFCYTDNRDSHMIQAKQLKINQKVEAIINHLGNCSTEYDKAKGVYNYLIANTVYDEHKDDQSMYSVLVEGRGVCSGYAKSFQYLMNRMGVQATLVTGDLRGQKGSITQLGGLPFIITTGHAWNLVKVDNDWYHVDVTSGDAVSSKGDVSYEFFLLSPDEIKKTHSIDSTVKIPQFYLY